MPPPRTTIPKYGVSILTSDPASGVVEAVAKGGHRLRISVVHTPVAFRWPVAGEAWVVRQENGNWYLEAPYPQTSPAINITTIAPGDAVINSPTGSVHVLGSTDGATDFSFTKASFGGGGPTGPAGGDLSGTYPNPGVATVLGGQTPVVSTDSRLTDSRTPSGTASGDLSGSYPGPTVAQLQGRPVSSSVPGANQGLVWTGTTWAPAALANSFNGRTGAVTPVSGDYTAAQVTNAADKSSATQQAFSGEIKAPDFAPAGLSGATATGRYVGTTVSGAPTSGTFAVGDWVTDQAGIRWTCTTAGTPGTWKQEPGTASGPNVAMLNPLPSHSFTATSATFASIGHTVNVTTLTGIVMFYYVADFGVSGAGTGGAQVAIFVDGTKVTGPSDSVLADAKLTMAGTTTQVYIYTDGSDGGWALPSPFNAGSVTTRVAGQRGLNVSTGMASAGGTSGQVNLGSPIMLKLTAGTRTIDVRWAPTAPNPPTMNVSNDGFMVAVGF